MECHICKTETDFECEDCQMPVCDNCTMPYNQFTQIDWTQCTDCGERHQQRRAYEYFAEIEEEKAAEKKRQERNEKARDYYNSDKAREKRRLKKIEQQELRKKADEERSTRIAGILSDIFKHM